MGALLRVYCTAIQRGNVPCEFRFIRLPRMLGALCAVTMPKVLRSAYINRFNRRSRFDPFQLQCALRFLLV